jgi:transposase-like protein
MEGDAMVRAAARRRWRELLAEQQRSGLSVAEFCRRREVSENSFYYWRRRLLEEGAPQAEAFMPLTVVGTASVEIELPCGAVVRVPASDERSLRTALSTLMQQGQERTT